MYRLSRQLIDALHENRIRYCHWKSNLLIAEALGGYDDLDLLVRRSDVSAFEAILFSLGFKEASNKNLEIASVKHFYGHDTDTGEILHLHVYYQIKTGPSWTKSIRFDFEPVLLENAVLHETGILVPEKHIEYVMFIIRIMMKYSKVNEYLLVRREEKRTVREIAYLRDGMDRGKLRQFLSERFESLSEEDLERYAAVILKGSFVNRFRNAMELRRKIRKYIYQGPFENAWNNFTQLCYRVSNKLVYKQKKNLHSGGAVIVVAGLDATGKTTITGQLKKWLGKNFTVREAHFGKPSSTWLTFPFNFLIRIARRKTSIDSDLRSSTKKEGSGKSMVFIVRQVILAYDRYALAKRIWKKAGNGNIILCDRYKSEDFGVMDSKRLIVGQYSGFKRKLAALENRLYEKMPQPDVMFYLTVPVDVAVKRNEERIKKGKESEQFLRIRHEQNQNLQYKAKVLAKVNTDQPFEAVIAEIKSVVWNNI